MYLVPKNVRARFELVPGFGIPELALCAVGLVVGATLGFVFSLFNASPLVRMVLLVVPTGFMFFATRPGLEGESLFGLVVLYRRWKTGQRRYFNVPQGGEFL
ncbi:MAG: hypothetical protein KGZ53_02685 [Peptococcaceae bacterium]|nr:hypothetical protein [Peptococcaceae bacterium]